MRILPITHDSLHEAIATIQSGGTIVYPTETAYALGADPLNPKAVRAVFALKGRNEGKPLGLIASSIEQVQAFCLVEQDVRPLLRHWPGPLSIILPVRWPTKQNESEALAYALADSTAASIRVSSHPIAKNLADAVGHPIIATSANRSGAGGCFALDALKRHFAEPPQPDLILDGGTLPEGPMSTVVRVVNGTAMVLREGAVKV